MSSELPIRRAVVAAIGCVSAALLMTELALTRIFSVTMYYHFAFLAISIALFGLSASGVYVYLARGVCSAAPTIARSRRCPPLRGRDGRRAGCPDPASRRAELFARESRADAGHLRAGRAALLCRRCRYLAGDLPVAARVNVVYAADLFGAAPGCLLLIPLLNRLVPPEWCSSPPACRRSGGALRSTAATAAAGRCQPLIVGALPLVVHLAGAPSSTSATPRVTTATVCCSASGIRFHASPCTTARTATGRSARVHGPPCPIAVHGHRLGGLDADPPSARRSGGRAYLRYELTAIAYHSGPEPGRSRAALTRW